MLIKLAHYRFLLVGILLIFAASYLWCFINPEEVRGEQHNDSHGLGNGFCFHFYNQNLHIGASVLIVFMVVLSTVLLPTLGEILPGFTHPLIKPPRSLLT